MRKLKNRRIISLIMSVMLAVSLINNPAGKAMAEGTQETSSQNAVSSELPQSVTGPAIASVTGSAIGSVTGSAITVEDPITPDMVQAGVSTIDQIYSKDKGTIATVIGQVSYIYGSTGKPDTAILQDVINGEIIGFQIYDKANISKYIVGDIVEVTGTVDERYAVKQIKTVTNITSKGNKTQFQPQELTIAEMIAGGDKYLSEYVRIKNVILGTYNNDNKGNTELQDSTGKINIYNAAKYPDGIIAGNTVDVVAAFSKYNTTYQLRNGANTDYSLSITVPVDAVSEPEISPSKAECLLGQEISLVTSVTGAAIYYSVNDGAFALYDDTAKPVVKEFPYKLTAYASKVGMTDSAKVTKEYTQSQVAAVEASEVSGAVKLGTKLQLTSKTEGAEISYSSDNGANWTKYSDIDGIVLKELPATIIAKAIKVGYKDSTESVFNYTKKLNDGYNIYFGQIHSHSKYSDGQGTCEDAFAYAKNTAEQIDFLAVTDHSNSFDNADSASILDGAMSTEWVTGHQLADQYTDNTFVGIYAYEMTWSNGLGHMNTFNTQGFQSRDQKSFSTYSTALQTYYAALASDINSFSQFNHPGNTFGDFNDFSNYSDTADQSISLIEVGNGEGAVGGSGYFASYEYYTRALDKGWHLAPANNQDNHKGLWGNSNTARTVVLADSLTRDNIYNALRNMRTYATEDNDLEITYTLNGDIMGTVMQTKPSKVNISVKLKDPTDPAIGKVDVIVNGGLCIASMNVNSSEDTVNFELPADYSYYYIRITQNDKDIAVTAPVWISDVEAVGVQSITANQAVPVKGETLQVTTKMFNNETEPLNLQSMEFSVDGTVIHTVDLNAAGLTSVAAGSTGAYTFDYLSDKVGAVNINVTVNATLGGVAKIFKGVLKLDYSDPSAITKVIVDGTHYNDYVTGYYGGNMSNFIEIAAKQKVKVTIVKDKITEAILSDCDLLIVSAPAKKKGTTGAGDYTVAHFDDEFINLVKDYTSLGGDLVVCGLADYQDSADGQSSTEINKLLQAISATSRINSDEAMDDVDNGGQAYRLYLTDYNTGSAFTNGVAVGQKYSSYSGCTVLLDESAVAAGKAQYLVKGHTTTYSIDSKTYGGNYTPITQGNAIFLAKEGLLGGGNLFVSGTVFMSNYEVKAVLDNVWDQAYSNRTIMENILKSVAKQMKVSTVAEVRSGAKGSIYCVEGTVTAGTASGNAFFDTIYVQDATGGINLFPVNQGTIELGQKVRAVGYLDEYLGDLELRVTEVSVTDTVKNPVVPTLITTKDAADYTLSGGKLVRIKGVVTSVIQKNGTVETITVFDNSGKQVRVFIDGYIGYSNANSPKLEDIIKVGEMVSVIGLVSYDTEGVRIRVRDRSEIGKDSPGSTPIPTSTPTSTQTPTPTATPTPTPTPTPVYVIKNVTVEDKDCNVLAVMSATKQKGHLLAEVQIDAKQIAERAQKEATKANPLHISIPASSQELIKELKNGDINDAQITVTLPQSILSNDKIVIDNIKINADLIQAAAQLNKDFTVTIKDETGKVYYTWSFKAKDLKNSKNELGAVNLVVSVSTISDNDEIQSLFGKDASKEESEGLVLSFGHDGALPAQAQTRIYVGHVIGNGQTGGVTLNRRVFLYHYNKTTKRLETLPHSSSYKVDKDGFITVNLLHCSDYVILSKAVDSSLTTSVINQIAVTPSSKTLNIAKGVKSFKVGITMPNTLEWVDDLDDAASGSAVGAVDISFKSSNKKVAVVDKDGNVTAVAPGKATITVTINLYSGKTRTVIIKVTVK